MSYIIYIKNEVASRTKSYINKEKQNGFPNHLEIGDILEIYNMIIYSSSSKHILLEFRGKKSKTDRFKIHSSYFTDIASYRDQIIDGVLENDKE